MNTLGTAAPSAHTSLQHAAVYVFLSLLNSAGAVLIPSAATPSDD